MDLLADVLSVSGVRGTLGARIEATDDWSILWTDDPATAFYAVTEGTAWLGIPGSEPLELRQGDVVLLPRGKPHSIASSADGPAVAHSCDPVLAAKARAEAGVLRFGDGVVTTHILGASFASDPAVTQQVLALLPDVVRVRPTDEGSCLDDTVRLLARELAYPQMGSSVVLDRLVDILLVQLLRGWLATSGEAEASRSWWAVLGDPLLSEAMGLLHGDPSRPWTTESLAAEMAVSRATLSRRFASVTGDSPGAYLTRWRMDLAALRLRDTDETLEQVAASVGYTSVYAFSRAFSRLRGVPPGRFRAASRAQLARVA